MDSLEVSVELRDAVKRLMEEASVASGHRLELLLGLSVNDVAFELKEPSPNGAPIFQRPGACGRFKVREERWRQEMMSPSLKLAKAAIKKLSEPRSSAKKPSRL